MPASISALPPDRRYDEFAREIVATGAISDPWIYGRPRFRLEPVVLDPELWRRLAAAAESIGRAFDEGARLVWERPELLDDYFHLTPWQRAMWLASDGRWHGIARLDLFVLEDGTIQCCEMNSDTPSGEAETVLLNRLRHAEYPELIDPNAGFEERFVDMLRSMASAAGRRELRRAGIVYPTDMTEDLSMITIYRDWLQSRGIEVVTGGPHNLGAHNGALTLMGVPVDVVIRHYKTDWWGERLPAWSDEPEYEDPDPLVRPLRLLLTADADGSAAVANPFGSVLTQNKLMMAFLWDHLDLMSHTSAAAIRSYIPQTIRLADACTPAKPRAGAGGCVREAWVLKSDYGCEGDEVIIGRDVTDQIWAESLEKVVPDRWILQRYFAAAADGDGAIPNYGVYLLGGIAAGIFTWLSPKATDTTAVSAATFITPDRGSGAGGTSHSSRKDDED